MHTLYQISNGILHEAIGDEVIALDMQSGTYFSLRDSAAWIWQLLSQPVSIDQILTAITDEYRVDRALVAANVQAFLVRLQEAGLIEGVTAHREATLMIPLTANAEPYTVPELEVFTDVQELLTIDPIHDVDEMGWPQPKQMVA